MKFGMDPNQNNHQPTQEGMNKSLRELDDSYRKNAPGQLVTNLPENAHTTRTMYYANPLALNQVLSRESEASALTAYPEIRSHLQELHPQTQNIFVSSEVRQNLSSSQIYEPPSIEMPRGYQPCLSPTPVYKFGYEEGYQAGVRDALRANASNLCLSCSSMSLPANSSYSDGNLSRLKDQLNRSNVDFMNIQRDIVDLHQTVPAPLILEDCDVSFDDLDRSGSEFNREVVQGIPSTSGTCEDSFFPSQTCSAIDVDVCSQDTESQTLHHQEHIGASEPEVQDPLGHLSVHSFEPNNPNSSFPIEALTVGPTSSASVRMNHCGVDPSDNGPVSDLDVAAPLGIQMDPSFIGEPTQEAAHAVAYGGVEVIGRTISSRLEVPEVFAFEPEQSNSISQSTSPTREILEVPVTEPMETFGIRHGISHALDTKDSVTSEPVQSDSIDRITSTAPEIVEVPVTETVAETVRFSVSRQSTPPASDYQSLSSDSIHQDGLLEPFLEDHVTDLAEPEAELNVISSKGLPSDEILDREYIIEPGHVDDSLYRSLPSFQEDSIRTTIRSSPSTQADNNFCSVESDLPIDAEKRTSENPISVSDSVPEHPDLDIVQVDSLQESSPVNDSLSVPEDLDVSPTLQTSIDFSDLNRCRPSSNARDSDQGPQDECSSIFIIQSNHVHSLVDSDDEPDLTQESSPATLSNQPGVVTPDLSELTSNTESSSRMSESSNIISSNFKRRRPENGTVTQPGSSDSLKESLQKRQRINSPGVSDGLEPIQSLVVDDAHPIAEDSEIPVNDETVESDSEVNLLDTSFQDASMDFLSPPATHVRSGMRRLPSYDSDQGGEFSDSENEADNSLFGFYTQDFSQPGYATTANNSTAVPSIQVTRESGSTPPAHDGGDLILGSDGEYYDYFYETVSASEYATNDEGGVLIQIKPRRRERKLFFSYRLKISNSRELSSLGGTVPREVSTPYALRRTLPEGTPKKKRRTNAFTPAEGGPWNSTSLTRANATPYILREEPIEVNHNPNMNTSLNTLCALSSPRSASRTPRSRRRFSRPPPCEQLL